MNTTAANQRRSCAADLYGRGGHYVLCAANVDLFGVSITGGGYHDIRPLSYEEALTIHLAPLHGLRHAAGVEER